MRTCRLLVWAVALALLLGACSEGAREPVGERGASIPAERPTAPEPAELPAPARLAGITTSEAYGGGSGLERWTSELPAVHDVRIPSSLDGEPQPALWLPASGEGPRPLLVVLHSWSDGYDQHYGIPFGLWARQQGWAMIHPHYRGVFDRPEATGSDLAVADVIDAIDFAVSQGGIDEDQVFATGYSGGGMMSLLLAGRHPHRFAGVAAWVPIYDLVAWYEHNVLGQTRYVGQITASCGGDPLVDDAALAECTHRSPSAHLVAARDAQLPVYIAAGLGDENVPAEQAARAFNALADEPDRFTEQALASIAQRQLPPDLVGDLGAEAHFGPGDPPVVLSRSSAAVTLTLFDGGHEMAFHPALEWMHRLSSR